MYLALFFVPWIAMYSLSTLFFNHGVRAFGKGPFSQFQKESEQVYGRAFPEGATPQAMAKQILSDLQLSGTHDVNRRPDGSVLISRQDPVTPRRITYVPKTGSLILERHVVSFPTWLRLIHHRTGFGHEEALEDGWALSVDLVILAMLFWVVSGMWMWLELRATRKWGLLCMLSGAGLFLFLSLAI
jgi:hypothetical protein